jgi:uncharacterized membrane protein
VPRSQPPTSQSPTKSAEGGFVLIVTAIALTLLMGLAGLAIDLGRMYVIRGELQSFTDAAALNAALAMDGSAAGKERARKGAAQLAQGPHGMRWDMGTQTIDNIDTSFPADANGRRLVRVAAIEPAPIIFMRLFQPFGATKVAVASVAERKGGSVRLIE